MRFPSGLALLLASLLSLATACSAPPEPPRATVTPAPTATPAPTVDVEATVQVRLQEERAKLPTPAPATEVPSEANAAERLLPSVVRVSTDTGMGSGVIVAEGLVITNRHVVEDGTTVTVQPRGGKEISATVLAKNSMLDVALLRATGVDAPAAALADLSRMKAGESVLAIGYPLDLKGDPTVTRGLFSAVRIGEPLPGEWVQTDAAVNPGNSGGPLANLRGEVVGLITLRKLSDSVTPVEGINFALSASSLRDALPAMLLSAGIIPPGGQEASPALSGEIADFLQSYDRAEIDAFSRSDDSALKELATPSFHSFASSMLVLQKARNLRRDSELLEFKLLSAYSLPGDLVVADVLERWHTRTYRNNRLMEDEGETDQPQVAVVKRAGNSWRLAGIQFKER